MDTRVATALFFSLITFLPTLSSAAFEENGCERLVNGCLSRSLARRDECFNSIADSPVCVGSPLGDLVSKRARLTPSIPWGEPEGPAFLGPREFDRTCVDSFDLQLGSALSIGHLDTESGAALQSHLNRCGEPAPSELFRP